MTTKQKALGYLCDIETRLNTFDGTYSWGLEIQTLRAALEAPDLAEVVLTELQNARGCFDAANIEGLYDKLAEQTDTEAGSLYGLVTRRLLYAVDHIDAAIALAKEQKQ